MQVKLLLGFLQAVIALNFISGVLAQGQGNGRDGEQGQGQGTSDRIDPCVDEFSCSEDTDGEVIPHPDRCQDYFQCVGARLERQSCPNGHFFDQVYLQCMRPSNVRCQAKCPDGIKLVLSPPVIDPPVIDPPRPQIQPPVPVSEAETTSTTTTLPPKTLPTRPRSPPQGVTRPTAQPPAGTPGPATTIGETDICLRMFNCGIPQKFPDPTNCRQYYECDRNQQIVSKRCPPMLSFDKNERRCIQTADAVCQEQCTVPTEPVRTTEASMPVSTEAVPDTTVLPEKPLPTRPQVQSTNATIREEPRSSTTGNNNPIATTEPQGPDAQSTENMHPVTSTSSAAGPEVTSAPPSVEQPTTDKSQATTKVDDAATTKVDGAATTEIDNAATSKVPSNPSTPDIQVASTAEPSNVQQSSERPKTTLGAVNPRETSTVQGKVPTLIPIIPSTGSGANETPQETKKKKVPTATLR